MASQGEPVRQQLAVSYITSISARPMQSRRKRCQNLTASGANCAANRTCHEAPGSDHAFGSVSWTAPTTAAIVVGTEPASAGFMGRRLAFGLDLAFDFCFAVRVFVAFDPTERVAFLAERFAGFLRALATLSST